MFTSFTGISKKESREDAISGEHVGAVAGNCTLLRYWMVGLQWFQNAGREHSEYPRMRADLDMMHFQGNRVPADEM